MLSVGQVSVLVGNLEIVETGFRAGLGYGRRPWVAPQSRDHHEPLAAVCEAPKHELGNEMMTRHGTLG